MVRLAVEYHVSAPSLASSPRSTTATMRWGSREATDALAPGNFARSAREPQAFSCSSDRDPLLQPRPAAATSRAVPQSKAGRLSEGAVGQSNPRRNFLRPPHYDVLYSLSKH